MAERYEQYGLFSIGELRQFRVQTPQQQYALEMDAQALHQWKAAIASYQGQVRTSQPSQQGTLFQVPQATVDPEQIDPYALPLHNFLCFQWPSDRNPNEPCIYFVLDLCGPLVLYIGETCKANQRWSGQHDCKRYVQNYQNLHYQYGLKTAINTAFWWETPTAPRPRQRLEASLIARWKSPFNKENWQHWHTPFVEF